MIFAAPETVFVFYNALPSEKNVKNAILFEKNAIDLINNV